MFKKISFVLLGATSTLLLAGCTVDRVTEYEYYPPGYYSTTTSPNTYYYESGSYRHRHHGRRPYVGPGPVINPNSGYQTNTSPNNPVPNTTINTNTAPNAGSYTTTTVPSSINDVPQPVAQPLKPKPMDDNNDGGGFSTNTSAN